MEKLTLWLLFISSWLHLKGQSFPPLYETLRNRYFQDFFFVDSLSGGGIPVARIREKACNHAYYIHQTCPAAAPSSGTNLWEWSDGTVHLGFHFFTFGLELAYAQKEKLEISSTLLALKSGFQALERLEKVAAAQQKTAYSPGFLARDDAEFTTLMRWQKKGCVKSQYLCDVYRGRKNAMSQDQLIYLVWGLDAVVHAGKNEVYLPLDSIPLSMRAIFWKKRLLDRALSNAWRIIDEHGEKVEIGHQVWFWAWPLIRHTSAPEKANKALAQWLLWKSLLAVPYLPETPLHHEVNLAMQLVLASMEKSFQTSTLPLAVQAQMDIFPASAWWKMEKKESFPLWARLDSMVKTIPIEGPNYLNENVPLGWRGENRWFHPNRNQGVHWEKEGRFNGLDAMSLILMHSLLTPHKANK